MSETSLRERWAVNSVGLQPSAHPLLLLLLPLGLLPLLLLLGLRRWLSCGAPDRIEPAAERPTCRK